MITINGNPVNTTMFPDGTSQVWKVSALEIPGTNFVNIKWTFDHESEFMQLAQLKSLIDRCGFSSALTLSYLPYGRQDKPVANDATFALRTFANLLNTLNFDEVTIHDPHSKVALDLINNSKAKYFTKDIYKIIKMMNMPYIAYPDAGALEKYDLMIGFPCVWGNKVRDQATGKITSYKLEGDVANRDILIVDDICDGGATFVHLAKALKEAGAKEIYMFVTHGIFSNGLKVLTGNGISRIFTQRGEALTTIQNYEYGIDGVCYHDY